MLDPTTVQRLDTAKFEARCSVHIHKDRLNKIERQLRFIEFLGLAVPVLLLSVQVVSSGEWRRLLESASQVAGGLLGVAVIYSWAYDLKGRLKNHQRFISENIPVIAEIEGLLSNQDADSKDAARILDRTTALDKEEMQVLPDISENERKRNYLLALRDEGVHARCPLCNASPWQFNPGSCQVCGNTPATSVSLVEPPLTLPQSLPAPKESK